MGRVAARIARQVLAGIIVGSTLVACESRPPEEGAETSGQVVVGEPTPAPATEEQIARYVNEWIDIENEGAALIGAAPNHDSGAVDGFEELARRASGLVSRTQQHSSDNARRWMAEAAARARSATPDQVLAFEKQCGANPNLMAAYERFVAAHTLQGP